MVVVSPKRLGRRPRQSWVGADEVSQDGDLRPMPLAGSCPASCETDMSEKGGTSRALKVSRVVAQFLEYPGSGEGGSGGQPAHDRAASSTRICRGHPEVRNGIVQPGDLPCPVSSPTPPGLMTLIPYAGRPGSMRQSRNRPFPRADPVHHGMVIPEHEERLVDDGGVAELGAWCAPPGSPRRCVAYPGPAYL